MTKNLTHIGTNIRRMRTERSWTQQELANKAGISRIALIHIEHSKANPSLETALSLGASLGVTLSRLLAPPMPKDFASLPVDEQVLAEQQEHAHELESLSQTLANCSLNQLVAIRKMVTSSLDLFPKTSNTLSAIAIQ